MPQQPQIPAQVHVAPRLLAAAADLPSGLVAHRDPRTADSLAAALAAVGLRVLAASDGPSVVEQANSCRPAIVLLEHNLFGGDGLELCRAVRATDARMGVLVTGSMTEPSAVAAVYDSGADDYLPEPLSVELTTARVRALLRRAAEVPGHRVSSPTLRWSDLDLDVELRLVRRAGQEVELTATELLLMRHFIVNAERVVTTGDLQQLLWPGPTPRSVNTLHVHVSGLRAKLEASGSRIIHTARGTGYVLRRPVQV